jgi:hypothetical protein
MAVYLSNWLMFYPMAISLFVALRLSQATTDSRQVSASILAVRSTLVVMLLLTLISVGTRSTPLSLMWLLIAGSCGTVLYIRQRQMSRAAVTMTLLSCDNLIQLRRAATFIQEEQSGWLRRRINRFLALIDSGVEGTVALEASRMTLTAYERLTARLSHQFGRADASQQDLLAPLRVAYEYERLLGRLGILAWCLGIAPIFVLYQIFVIPTLLQMLEEFGISAPWALNVLVQQSRLVIFVAAIIPLALLCIAGTAVLLWLNPVFTQWLPLRWLCGTYYRSLGAIAFARVARHTQEPVSALRQTSQLLPIRYLSEKFDHAARRVEMGDSVAKAMASANLLPANYLGNFSAELDTAGLAWATEQLATWDTDRTLNRYSLLIQCLLVGVTLLFAGFVALVCVGMIQTLTEMIHQLT